MKQQKPLTKEQYLKKFSRAVRWRLPPQESEEAIADYRELIFQEEREESRLVEELGTPVQAAHLLTDVKAYRRWLAVFAVLAFGLFLLVKWAWTGMAATTGFFSYSNVWYPVWVMVVGMLLSLYWFRRHGQKNGPLSKRLAAALMAVLVLGAAVIILTWYIFDPVTLEGLAREVGEGTVEYIRPWWVILERELLIEGGVACAVTALAGLVLAKCYDRRWLALYLLCLTLAAMFGFLEFHMLSMDISARGSAEIQAYLFTRLIPIGVAGLIGTGVALC